MKFSITETKDVDAKYLQVDAGVRYWEDGLVNGLKTITTIRQFPSHQNVGGSRLFTLNLVEFRNGQ